MVNSFNNRLLIEIIIKNEAANIVKQIMQAIIYSHKIASVTETSKQTTSCLRRRKTALRPSSSTSASRDPSASSDGGEDKCLRARTEVGRPAAWRQRPGGRTTATPATTSSPETSFASALSCPPSVNLGKEEALKVNSKATITLMSKLGMKYLM
jgi:hypothetical protein